MESLNLAESLRESPASAILTSSSRRSQSERRQMPMIHGKEDGSDYFISSAMTYESQSTAAAHSGSKF